jgi:hypothetical protein
VAACTSGQPPAVTPTTTVSSSPTPSATPSETDIERQMRLDWEAAEKAYRDATLESDRLARKGGVVEPSPKLKAVSSGEYLALTLDNLRLLRSRMWRFEGGVTILAVKPNGGWTETQLDLLACEDNSTWKLRDASGRDVTPKNQEDYIQTLTVRKQNGSWKVSSLSTKKVKNVTAEDCA